MDDENGRGQRGEYRSGYQPRRFASFIEQRKRRAHQQRAEQHHTSTTDRAIRSTKNATWVLAFVGAIALGLGILQYFVLAGQLDEMKSSGEQTERAIQATNRIAEEAARNTAESQRLVDESHRLAEAAAQSAAETRRLADEAARTANAASEANDLTRRLAQEASRGNAISQQALFGVQRAFMFVHDVTTEDLRMPVGVLGMTIPAGWRANVIWENAGNTPTKDLVVTTHCVASLRPVADPFAILITDPKNDKMLNQDFPAIFGPKQVSIGGICPIPLGYVAFGKLLGIGHYYAFGTARYRDILRGANAHRTDFCFELEVTGGQLSEEFEGIKNPPPVHIIVHHCASHNCADDECKPQDKVTARNAVISPPDLSIPKVGDTIPPSSK